MGLLSGSISYRRYKVLGKVPSDWRELFEKSIRAHALVPNDPDRNEERSIGWASLHDAQDTDLNLGKVHESGRLLLSLRIDTLKVPADELKRRLRKRQREIEAERQAPLSAVGLRDLKEILKVELRKTTPVKTRAIDVLWDLDAGRLMLCSHSKAANEAFVSLFAQTFNIPLDLDGPGLWAHEYAELRHLTDGLKAARPTAELLGGFPGLRPGARQLPLPKTDQANTDENMVDMRFLGREFLTWLLCHADAENGDGLIPGNELCDSFRVMVGERILLKALGDGSVEMAARGAAPAQTADVRYCLTGGLTVREASLLFAREDRIWIASVRAEGFDMRGVKLPALLSDEDTERAHERLELIDELNQCLRAAFNRFLYVRLTPDWQQTTVPAMRAWLKRSTEVQQQNQPPV
jgi:hypothetical protein